MGGGVISSIARGAGDEAKSRRAVGTTFVMLLAAALPVMALLLFAAEPICRLLGGQGGTLEQAVAYTSVIAWGVPFQIFVTGCTPLIRNQGRVGFAMAVQVFAGLMNVVLDYIFVMHLHWGVWGAALATGLAQATSTAVFAVYFLTHRYPLRFGRFKPDPGAYRRIIPLGTADGLSELSNGMVIFLFNHIIQRVIGPGALVSYTIISYVNTLVLNSVIGIAHGIQPLCSYHLGAEERPVCHKFLTYGIRLAACFAAGFFVLCQVLAGAVVGLFLQPDSALFASSVSALRLYSFAFLFVGFNVVISGFFTAMEHPIPSLTISFGRGLVLISGCLVVLAFLFGANGIWLSPLVSESLCLLITLFFLIRYFRRVRREASGERDGIPDARPLD